MGLRTPPFAFTEHGVLMLSSVLKSERAVQINIRNLIDEKKVEGISKT